MHFAILVIFMIFTIFFCFSPGKYFQINLAFEQLSIDLWIETLELLHLLSKHTIHLVGIQYTF